MSKCVRLDVILLGLATSASAAACGGFLHPATESAVTVHGRVAGVPTAATCSLRLVNKNGTVARELTIAPDFQRGMTIAPGQHEYYIEIGCPGQPGGFRSQVYTLGGMREIDLGAIVLKD